MDVAPARAFLGPVCIFILFVYVTFLIVPFFIAFTVSTCPFIQQCFRHTFAFTVPVRPFIQQIFPSHFFLVNFWTELGHYVSMFFTFRRVLSFFRLTMGRVGYAEHENGLFFGTWVQKKYLLLLFWKHGWCSTRQHG